LQYEYFYIFNELPKDGAKAIDPHRLNSHVTRTASLSNGSKILAILPQLQ
jgi:hypothetical protein